MKQNSSVDELIVYTNPQSRGAIALWMLEEAGAPYEIKVMPYGSAFTSEEYLRLNPMAKVPTLVHGNQVVTESAAICAYLADAFPQNQLAPETPRRGAYYRWLFFAAGPLEAAVTNKALGFEVPSEKQGFVGYGSFERVTRTLTEAIRKGPYIADEKFSAADVYVGSHIGWGLQFGTIPESRELRDYWERISSRDAYKRANDKNASLQLKS